MFILSALQTEWKAWYNSPFSRQGRDLERLTPAILTFIDRIEAAIEHMHKSEWQTKMRYHQPSILQPFYFEHRFELRAGSLLYTLGQQGRRTKIMGSQYFKYYVGVGDQSNRFSQFKSSGSATAERLFCKLARKEDS